MVRPAVRAGFTLVEIVIVVLLIALGAAMAPPSLRQWRPRPEASVIDSVVALVASTRTLAIEQGAAVTLVLGPTSATWWRVVGQAEIDRGGWSPERARVLASKARVELSFASTGEVWASEAVRVAERGDTVTLLAAPWTGRVRLR